jgi:hypothetical protein
VTPTPPIPLAAPAEAWWLWVTVVALGIVVALLVAWLRRWLLRPMRHTPTSTTDAWTEAGRRFRMPDEARDNDTSGGGNGDAP